MIQKHTRTAILLGLTLAACSWIVGATVGMDRPRAQQSSTAPASTSPAATAPGATTPGESTSTTTQTSPTSTSSNPSSGKTGSTPAQPANAACTTLTSAIAQQILGASAQAQSSPAATISSTSATTVSACAYVAGDQTMQLTLRVPKNSLGTSENATAFGSERPAGVTPVTGHGQTAYWNPATSSLNILSGNKWYSITRTSATQANTEQIAQAMHI
jgi:hypothetical protein